MAGMGEQTGRYPHVQQKHAVVPEENEKVALITSDLSGAIC